MKPYPGMKLLDGSRVVTAHPILRTRGGRPNLVTTIAGWSLECAWDTWETLPARNRASAFRMQIRWWGILAPCFHLTDHWRRVRGGWEAAGAPANPAPAARPNHPEAPR